MHGRRIAQRRKVSSGRGLVAERRKSKTLFVVDYATGKVVPSGRRKTISGVQPSKIPQKDRVKDSRVVGSVLRPSLSLGPKYGSQKLPQGGLLFLDMGGKRPGGRRKKRKGRRQK